VYPILARYGSFLFYSYTAAMGAGLLLALGLAWRQARRSRTAIGTHSYEGWPDAVIVGLAVALVVGRVLFVAVNWDYYQDNLDESWLLWQGGISYHGAVLTGLLALWVWSRLHGVSFGALGGLLALPAAVWSAFGWLACYLDGCAYGRETLIGPLAADLPDNFGVFAVRYQTQLMGVALSLLALALLWWARRRMSRTALFWTALFLLSAGRAAVDVVRGDPMRVIAGLRLDFVADATLALAAVLGLVVTLWRNGISRHDAPNRATRDT